MKNKWIWRVFYKKLCKIKIKMKNMEMKGTILFLAKKKNKLVPEATEATAAAEHKKTSCTTMKKSSTLVKQIKTNKIWTRKGY